MFRLYFKHMYPSYPEWRNEPFCPWSFGEEGVLLTVLSFFEKELDDAFSLRKALKCEVFMDSGAFSAAAMGFSLDPYEVAEMQALLKADLVVPLDIVITSEDSPEQAKQKVAETIRNTEILLDFLPKGCEAIGPLQGLTPGLIELMFTEFLDLGVKRFALGGVVFQRDIGQALERIKSVRNITNGYPLHVFGKFLHPRLLKAVMRVSDSVDGYGYILSSVKGLYIHEGEYKAIGGINEDQLAECPCSACQNTVLDFQRGDREAQHLIIQHNIQALIALKDRFEKEISEEKNN